jgi:UPF0755 protein
METTTPQRAGRHDRPSRRHDDLRPRRTTLLILFVSFLVLAGAVVWAGSYWSKCKEPASEGAQRDVEFSVADGATAGDVVDELAAKDVIRCGGFVGNLLMRGTGKADQIRAGDYQLTTGMTLDEVMTVITTAPKKVPTTPVLIPPGYRLTQIADTLQKELGISADAFMNVAQSGNYSLSPYLPSGSSTVEGFIWPETNRFPKHGATPDEVITTGLQQFKEAVADLPWDRAEGLHVTPYQVVTIASMIEKEAVLDKDRPLISAVIYNRLREGIPLGIDAANAYIDPDPSDGLTDADFAIDSPYNTRLHTGLPPTPIASPSLESLAAALDPANVGYLYYVACGDGGHRFSVDYDTFLANKAECLG